MNLDIKWTDEGVITIHPNEWLWQAIRNKEFIVDDVMGMVPDTNTYTDGERVAYFIEACIEHVAEMYDLQNPATWIEADLECLEEYKGYLKDFELDRDDYTEERYQLLKSEYERTISLLQEDVNCFCV